MDCRWAVIAESRRNWWVAAGLGAVIGGVFGFTIAIWPTLQWHLMGTGVLPAISSDWAAWVQAGGTILAIAAAAWIASWQLRETVKQEKERQKSYITARSRAAFVTLPNDLSAICKYIGLCAQLVLENTPRTWDCVKQSEKIGGYEIPSLPETLLQRVRDDIPFLAEIPADAISEMMSWYQIQNTRMMGINTCRTNTYSMDLIRDSVVLYIMANAIFDYARTRGRANISEIYDEAAIHNAVFALVPVKHRGPWVATLKEDLSKRLGHGIFSEENS